MSMENTEIKIGDRVLLKGEPLPRMTVIGLGDKPAVGIVECGWFERNGGNATLQREQIHKDALELATNK